MEKIFRKDEETGGSAKLIDEVYARVEELMFELKTLSDGDLVAMLRRANGEEKFAIRVTLSAMGRRDPTKWG